jgi:hypothetical protein
MDQVEIRIKDFAIINVKALGDEIIWNHTNYLELGGNILYLAVATKVKESKSNFFFMQIRCWS